MVDVFWTRVRVPPAPPNIDSKMDENPVKAWFQCL